MRLFGDTVGFTVQDPHGELPERRFAGFAAAAREVAESRILAGAQFRFSVEEGLDLGEQIGRQVLRSRLRPLEPRRTA